MSTAQTLIDKAAQMCGSRYQLSKLTGISQGSLSEMVAGTRPVPAALAGELASIVGEDPREAALRELVEKETKPERRERLQKLFGLQEWRKRFLSTLSRGVYRFRTRNR